MSCARSFGEFWRGIQFRFVSVMVLRILFVSFFCVAPLSFAMSAEGPETLPMVNGSSTPHVQSIPWKWSHKALAFIYNSEFFNDYQIGQTEIGAQIRMDPTWSVNDFALVRMGVEIQALPGTSLELGAQARAWPVLALESSGAHYELRLGTLSKHWADRFSDALLDPRERFFLPNALGAEWEWKFAEEQILYFGLDWRQRAVSKNNEQFSLGVKVALTAGFSDWKLQSQSELMASHRGGQFSGPDPKANNLAGLEMVSLQWRDVLSCTLGAGFSWDEFRSLGIGSLLRQELGLQWWFSETNKIEFYYQTNIIKDWGAKRGAAFLVADPGINNWESLVRDTQSFVHGGSSRWVHMLGVRWAIEKTAKISLDFVRTQEEWEPVLQILWRMDSPQ